MCGSTASPATASRNPASRTPTRARFRSRATGEPAVAVRRLARRRPRNLAAGAAAVVEHGCGARLGAGRLLPDERRRVLRGADARHQRGLWLSPGANTFPSVLCNKQDAESYAFFGDLNWHVTESVDAGCRRPMDATRPRSGQGARRRRSRRSPGGRPGKISASRSTWRTSIASDWPGNAGVRSDEESWSEPTYTARIGYQFTDDINSYLRYDRGFKSGGYNDQTGTATVILDAFLAPYDPEFADSYEAGLKTTWLEGRLRLNAALFYVEYTDAQRALVTLVCVPNPPSRPTHARATRSARSSRRPGSSTPRTSRCRASSLKARPPSPTSSRCRPTSHTTTASTTSSRPIPTATESTTCS